MSDLIWTPRQKSLGLDSIGNYKRAVVAGESDPYWANVSALLHFDSDYTDSSGKLPAFTTFGVAPTISTTEKKYGAGSAYFGANGNIDTTANNTDLNFGSGAFTVEFWTRRDGDGKRSDDAGNTMVYIGSRVSQHVLRIQCSSNANLSCWAAYNGSWQFQQTNITTLPDATWVHIAVVRSGSSLYVFKDGVLFGPYAFSFDFTSYASQLSLGSSGGVNTRYYRGYIDDVRITKGIARYTSNFTPPTGPYPDG